MYTKFTTEDILDHVQEAKIELARRFDEICKAKGWKACGLNADWALSVYQIDPLSEGERFGMLAIDNEDGTFSVAFAMNPDHAAELGFNSYDGTFFENGVTYRDHFKGDILGFIEYIGGM